MCSLHHQCPSDHALLHLRAQARTHPGLPPHNRTYFQMMPTLDNVAHTYILTALSHRHNRFHAVHHLLQKVGSNKQHNDPSADIHPGVPFIPAQHAWRFEWRAIIWSCPSDQKSRSVCLCREPCTARFSIQPVSSGYDISALPSTSVDTEDMGFS